jgi:transcriptional regulator with XRE-family HTH domain
MAGIERSYMGAIERGERNPSYDKIVSIAKALGTSVSNLVS